MADMADWAAAAFTGKDRGKPGRARGSRRTGFPSLLTPAGPPFSFVLGGKPSAELLKDWKRTAEASDLPDRTRLRVAWTDPKSGLRVAADVVVYKRYPAADWVLRFENTGKQDTPILEDIQALDVTLGDRAGQAAGHAAPPGRRRLQRAVVSADGEPASCRRKIRLAPNGGRPSNGTFPFLQFRL